MISDKLVDTFWTNGAVIDNPVDAQPELDPSPMLGSYSNNHGRASRIRRQPRPSNNHRDDRTKLGRRADRIRSVNRIAAKGTTHRD